MYTMSLVKVIVFVICLHSLFFVPSDAWVNENKLLNNFKFDETQTSSVKRPFRVDLYNATTKSFVSYIEINSSTVNNGLTLYVNILQDVQKPYLKALILLESSNGKYDLPLSNTTLNLCEFLSNRKYFPILQTFYKTFMRYSFMMRCPIRKVIIFSCL